MVVIKKTILILLITSLLVISTFALLSCGNNDNHSFENYDSESGNSNANENGNQSGSNDNTNENNSYVEGDSGELNFTLSESKDYYILTSLGNYSNKNVIIPSTYQNLEVKAIANNAFWGYDITSVVIPDSVTSIGDSAFESCINLASVTFGKGVTYIGNDAFTGCTGLLAVYIPDVSKWCEITFKNSASNPLSYAEGFYSINENGKTEAITDLVISNDVQSIGNYAFYRCSGLASVTIGNSVTTIGKYAFERCSNLTSVTIGNSVTSIGSSAFDGCSKIAEVYNLSDLNIIEGSSSNGSVGYYALSIYDSLEVASKQWTTEDGYLFYEDGEKCYLLGYTGENDVLTLPESCRGKNYEIYEDAFSNNDHITNVVISNGVTNIGEDAFSYCEKLEKVVVQNRVKEIGDGAFSGCSNLISVTLGSNVEIIGEDAFEDCYRLVEVINKSSLNITVGSSEFGELGYYAKEVHKGDTKVTNYNNYLFYANDSAIYLLKYLGNETNLLLPENYNGRNYEIYSYAFKENSDITGITIPNCVTSIGESAFFYCEDLVSVTIGDGVKIIGDSAFLGCGKLSNLNLGNGVVTIASEAFMYCDSLTSVTIPDSVQSVGSSAFESCANLISVTLGKNVTSIGNYAFDTFNKLVEVVNKSSLDIKSGSSDFGYLGYYAKEIHTGNTKIVKHNDYLFYTCSGTHYLLGYVGNGINLKLPENYKGEKYEIYSYAFYGNEDIKSIEFSNGISRVDKYAFAHCTNLSNIVFGNSVTSIGSFAFEGCSKLKSIVLPNSLKDVDAFAFRGCRYLTNIYIPSSVVYIGSCAFDECDNIKNISVQDTNVAYKSIDGNLYSKDGKIFIKYAVGKTDASFTIPNTVTRIDDSAFSRCRSFTSIIVPDGVKSIGAYAFKECSNLRSVTIPDSVTSVGNSAFGYCPISYASIPAKEISSMPKGVLTDVFINGGTSIDNSAFSSCNKLTSITIYNGIMSIGKYAFSSCVNLKTVYYEGTLEDWNDLSIKEGNSYLTSATIYFYSKEQPTNEGDYWYYDENGKVSIWE